MERIRNEAKALPLDEREALLAVLEYDLRCDHPRAATDPEIEAAWDEEIASRMKEVEEGKVTLISAGEFERDTQQLFAELGIQRPQRRA